MWRNLGFTDGNNIAYRLVSKEGEYVVLVNSNAIIYPDSLRAMVKLLEFRPSVVVTQGIIYKYDGDEIDSAGCHLNELMKLIA